MKRKIRTSVLKQRSIQLLPDVKEKWEKTERGGERRGSLGVTPALSGRFITRDDKLKMVEWWSVRKRETILYDWILQ